ncbi:MAG: hypothetical protein A2059_00290 [Ignavibacteria bacterium GWA2_55_25]|nr:MAG: hypothetical protein A2059_00290 [Ignavibacteria bacterium GWA2_55_25]
MVIPRHDKRDLSTRPPDCVRQLGGESIIDETEHRANALLPELLSGCFSIDFSVRLHLKQED